MAKSICDVLGIKYPIIQGGMAWISDAVMAAAVSNAGGAGIIFLGGRNNLLGRAEIPQFIETTNNPFWDNIFLTVPYKTTTCTASF